MKIPAGPSGLPTLSTNQFRTYGAGGHQLDEQEDDRGCPRLYYRRYESDEPMPKEPKSYPLAYGAMIHDVLFAMEEEGLDPEQALESRFDATLPFEAFEEARQDLARYLERGSSPRDRFATLAVEQELEATLMDDSPQGEIRFRGFVDLISVDPDDPTTIHVTDYKSNRSPARVADLRGDVQLRGYHWLVKKNAARFVDGPVNIVMHLDVIKFGEVEIRYSDEQIEDWEMWARAVARAIMQDEEHRPILNTYCSGCPVRHDCPAFEAMPETAQQLAGVKPPNGRDEATIRWRESANRMRLFLQKAVTAIDADFKARAEAQHGLTVGDWEWVESINWSTLIDYRALHAALGDERFYALVTTSKTAIDKATGGLPPHAMAAVREAVRQIPDGMKITRRKAG